MGLSHGGKLSIVAYGGEVQAIYSLRQLYKYFGPILKIRRSLDNTIQDFYFNNQYYGLDTSEILNFVGEGDGFVETWYDQSGNNKHATNTTQIEQPRIVSSGIIELKNNKPTIVFSGAQRLTVASSTLFGSSFGVFQRTNVQMVISQLASSSYRGLFPGSADDAYWTHSEYSYNGNNLVNINNGSSPLNSLVGNSLFQATGVGTPDSQPIQNKTHVLGFGTPSYAYLSGCISEIVIFNSDIRIKREYIEKDQMGFYGI